MTFDLIRLVRWKEWGASKIPPLFAAGGAWLLTNPPAAATHALARFAAWVMFCAFFLAFGYALNNYADRDADRRSVKSNEFADIDQRVGLLLLALLASFGAAVLTPFYVKRWVVILAAGAYLLGAAYSLPPARFKERGFAGVLVSAAAQRSLPLLVGMALFGGFDAGSWVLVLLFTLIGVRWILLHQLIDMPLDARGEVRTYARASGAGRTLWLLKRVVFPLEVICLAAWLFLTAGSYPPLWLMAPAYGAWLLARIALWRGVGPAFNWTAYWLHPLGDFYEIFWPLFIVLLLAARDPLYLPLPFFLLCWQMPWLCQQLPLLRRLLRPKLARALRLTSTGD